MGAHSALQLLATFTVMKYTSAPEALSHADITCSSHTHAHAHTHMHTHTQAHTQTHAHTPIGIMLGNILNVYYIS